MKKKGRANKIDEHVGMRLKVRRLQLEMSQKELAELLGITFQQVQKYEMGKDRVSAGNLYLISKILFVPITYFYYGVEDPLHPEEAMPNAIVDRMDISYEVLLSDETFDLAKLYYALGSKEERQEVSSFIEEKLKA